MTPPPPKKKIEIETRYTMKISAPCVEERWDAVTLLLNSGELSFNSNFAHAGIRDFHISCFNFAIKLQRSLRLCDSRYNIRRKSTK